jgi:iron(III) transport system substrate-binding protein
MALTGCVTSSDPGGLTLYNGQHPQTTAALVAAFEHDTGIQVQVRNDDEAVLAAQIVAEGSRSPADVFYSENSPPLEFLGDRDKLAQVDPSTLERVPARFNSPTGEWVGVSARVSMTVYNTDHLRAGDLPSSALDLADPRFRGKLALAPNETDFQPIVTAMVKRYGEAATLRWLQGVKDNAAGHIYPSNEALVAAVNAGQAAIGVINQYYWYRLRAQVGASSMHSALAPFAAGDPGYVLDVSGAAVLRSSQHQAEAQRFLAFLTSPKGQRIIDESNSFEYPVASHATARDQVPLSRLHPDSISVADLGDGAKALALLQRVQLL